MIFVSVGTNEARFDRLLRAIATLRIDEELLIQHGHRLLFLTLVLNSSTSFPSTRWSRRYNAPASS